ncbi:hypothetical protein C4571_02740 [Candidatus Parcubacteria bacterium]|nr:MAG: hypothetical protein C4571_02740 [Candidatus Parcubacteria bacterium]
MKKGQLTLEIMILGAISVILVSAFGLWAYSALKISLRAHLRAQAFSIAEAGIEYYRWHLAHNRTDYTDGTGQPGPYVHDYYDKDGDLIGQFSLEITPPLPGSTVVKIRSTGSVTADASIQKVIEVQFGIPSLGKYAIVANDSIRFGTGTYAFGQVHSNYGVRFDGVAYNTVFSAVPNYDDPDHGGGNEFGVHTHANPIDPLPPAAVPPRPDVFVAGRQFPVPAVDFTGLTSSFADIKAGAQSSGLYFGSSTVSGYHIVLQTNDTLDLYRVTTLVPKPPGCTDTQGQDGWGTWSIQSETLVGNYPFPSNGLIFVEDDLWVSGQIQTARLTIAAGRFPENSQTDKSITVNNDVLYTYYDGQDVLGLMAQKNFNIGLISEDDLRIDGALVAKNGRIGRYYYRPPTSQGQGGQNCQLWNVRSLITTYGMLASNKRYGFAYTDGTGYLIRNLYYDPNILYGPPPSFPLTSDQYVQISWEELK